jgi:hypothetical protein
MEVISILISVIALLVSLITLWLAQFQKGTIKMTRPTLIFFGFDASGKELKIFIRTLLYSTSERGQYIENMYIKLSRGKMAQDFNIWAYGDHKIIRGSGLFIGKLSLYLKIIRAEKQSLSTVTLNRMRSIWPKYWVEEAKEVRKCKWEGRVCPQVHDFALRVQWEGEVLCCRRFP